MKHGMRCLFMVVALLSVVVRGEGAADVLTPAAPGTVRIGGWLGHRMDQCLTQRVMAQDVDRIIKPYRDRPEENAGHWRCEYWGKWFTSVTLGYAFQPTDAYRSTLHEAVTKLKATQSPDGYIGTYKDGKHLGPWDVWGRKYTLLGLIAAYDATGDPSALDAACRVADHLLREAPPDKVKLTENGLDVLKGLASNSILEPMALLYQRTGQRRYLAFAEGLVANWSKPSLWAPDGIRLMEQAGAGTPPLRIASPKAYEMMSCFEGVCEMYRATGRRTYLDAALRFARGVRQTEIMAHGSGSNQELWCDGARVQTERLEQPSETCVTITWMKLCMQLLRLTGDSVWADDLEVALYNALLGAMTPGGDWWAYFSPMAGQRVPSHFQHADVGLSCCAANGPRGLLLTPAWAVMGCKEGLAVNLYGPGSATRSLSDGTGITLTQSTDYPVGDTITIAVDPSREASFTLRLRIPAWSRRTSLAVNGLPVAAAPGQYTRLHRVWKPGDKVVLKLDMRGRAVPAPSGAPQWAVMRGPILLAMDNRLTPPQNTIAVRLVTDAEGHVNLKPIANKPAEVWMAFEVPFEVRPSHFFKHHQIALGMCDYASAGNGWSGENLFRVWLPQPLFMHEAYPSETWRIMYPNANECPKMPY